LLLLMHRNVQLQPPLEYKGATAAAGAAAAAAAGWVL
jgi:hypothetical protein